MKNIKLLKVHMKAVLFTVVLLNASYIYSQRRMTSFDPKKHGYQFENTGFKPFIGDAGSFKIDFSGFCGGMVYSAGDYFYSGINAPDQDYSPAPGTKLYGHIHSRQSKSIENIAGQVAEYQFTVFNRDHEFWRWGVNEKLKDLIKNLDQGKPTPILLLRIDKGISENHWVMAIGYDLGGYNWGLENDPNVNNIKIFTYDPNESGRTMALIPRKEKWEFKYGYYDLAKDEFTSEKYDWNCRTFHPNKDFPRDFMRPPKISLLRKNGSGLVYRLVVKCQTGDDDLRGGGDQVSFKVKYQNGKYDNFPNANLSQRWPDRSTSNVELNLKEPVLLRDIRSIELSTNFRGGFNGENWKLNYLSIDAYRDNGVKVATIVNDKYGKPWKHFTGERKRIELINRFYKPDSAIMQNDSKKIISLNLLNISTPVHNNDCRRFQGKITADLINLKTGKKYSSVNGNILLSWEGNKSKDFNFRKLESLPTKEVKFYIDSQTLESGKYFFQIKTDGLQRCHKKCDFCSGYHCNIIYGSGNVAGKKKLIIQDNHYLQDVKLIAKNRNNGKLDGHDLNTQFSVTVN